MAAAECTAWKQLSALHESSRMRCMEAAECVCTYPSLHPALIGHCTVMMNITMCRFAAKCKRIQSESPHGRRPGWAVRPVIVKSGDDCRQELLAVQLISTFHSIFQVCFLVCILSKLIMLRQQVGTFRSSGSAVQMAVQLISTFHSMSMSSFAKETCFRQLLTGCMPACWCFCTELTSAM